jgi:hypothetical protein
LVPQSKGELAATPPAAATYNLYMPVNIDSKENMVYEAKHSNLQAVVDKQLPEDVLQLANELANELNEKFMTGLGNFTCQPSADSDGEEKSEYRLIFIGGSMLLGWHRLRIGWGLIP